jgi:dihydroorotase
MAAAEGTIITITKPDDWHLHLRDGEAMRSVLPHTAQRFGRAIIMPNLKPPVITVADAEAYHARILASLPQGHNFEPLMTLYLTPATTPVIIREAKASGLIRAVKLYPQGATTNSDAGVSSLAAQYPVFEAMQAAGVPLLVHGEVTSAEVDVFDREKVFLENELMPLVKNFPALRVVVEHITTSEAVAFVLASDHHVAATITAHHLLLNRNAIFAGGINPHHYCLPVLKREKHRLALVAAAISGNRKFFAGTDSAPHARPTKENACGCAGIYTAYGALEFYTEVFDEANALDCLEGFMSLHGPAFYGLPLNTGKVSLEKSPTPIPASFAMGKDELIPFRAGGFAQWSLRAPAKQ